MSDYIPSEVYQEILVRLPVDSLLRLRSVCKAWRHLIDHPNFVKSHHLFSSNHNTLLIRCKNTTGATPFYLINLDSIDFTKSDRQVIDAIPVKQLIRPEVPFAKFNRKTCNGLILISSDKIIKIWAIWNPFSRSCHQLPPPPDAADILSRDGKLSLYPATGFGYDYESDDYKVVRIDLLTSTREGVDEKRTLVYSLNLRCWRRIKDCPYDLWSFRWCSDDDIANSSLCCDPEGVFLNGAIHWLYKDKVYVLDLGTEDYRQLVMPPQLATIESESNSHLQLDAIGGCLCLTLSDREVNHFSGWVMKDYGADWVKLYALDLGRGVSGGIPRRLVAFWESKKQVLFQQYRGFLWYDVENGNLKQVTIHGLRITSSQICPGSIYPLDDSDSVSGNFGQSTSLDVCLRDRDTEYCSDSSCPPF